MPRGSPVRTLLARLSPSARALILASAVLGCAARVGVVVAAVLIVGGRVTEATMLGVGAVIAFAATRVIRTTVRTSSECDLYSGVTRAWIAADVLSVPVADPSRAVFEGSHQALSLVSDVIPALASDVAAVFIIGPILASVLPSRALAVALIGAVGVVIGLASVRRAYARLADRIAAARQTVVDLVLTAFEARLELVMRGGEPVLLDKLEAALARYRRVARTGAVYGALLGRAPIAAGVAMVAAGVLVDGAARASVASVLVGQSVIIAACIPPVLGLVLGANEIMRARSELRPLLDILNASPRPEAGSTGSAPPALPTEIELDGVSFRYGTGAADPLVLKSVNVAWRSSPLVVMGPNGSGKSTLLYLLGGLRPPNAGVVRAAGQDLQSLDVRTFRKRIAYLPQRPYLGEPHASVRDAMFQAVADADDATMTSALSRTGILADLSVRERDPLTVRVGELSAGQRQRVALARILLQNAALVLLDEPDANLDRSGITLLTNLVQELARTGTMIAIAAHTQELTESAATRVTLERAS